MLTKVKEVLNYLNGAADRTYQSIIDLAESLARTGIRLMYFVLLYKLAVGDLITQLLDVVK